jgi:hypothetical protein
MTTLEIVLMNVLSAQVIGGAIIGFRRGIGAQRIRRFTAKYTHEKTVLWRKGKRAGLRDDVSIDLIIVVKGSNDELREGMVHRAHQHPGIEDAVQDIVDNSIEFYMLKS